MSRACKCAHMYVLNDKTEETAVTATKTTRIKAALNIKTMKDFIVTNPQLTRLLMSIGISAAIGALFMTLLASPEQALAWRPIKGQPMVD